MTQAPTPGPLTDGWKQAKGSNPFPHGDDTPIRVRRDGEEWDAKASTFNWDLWVEWRPLTDADRVRIAVVALERWSAGSGSPPKGEIRSLLAALKSEGK